MNYLFVLPALLVLTNFTIGTAWGQMTPIRPAPVPKEQGSQLVPGAQAPFPVITFPASPSEPASQTAGSGSSRPADDRRSDVAGSSSAPTPQHSTKKQDEVKKPPIRVVRKHSHKQSVGAGDSAADFLNRQELSRITGVPGY